MLKIDVVDNMGDLILLKDVWNDLNEKGPDEVTLSFEWITSLWESHLDKEDAIVLLFKKDDRLIGIVPLYKKKILINNLFPTIQMGLISNLYCNHNDFIISEDKEECLAAMFEYFENKRIKWDLFKCSDFINTSPSVNILKDVSKRYGFSVKEIAGDSSPYLPIEGSFEDLLAKKKSKRRRDLTGEIDKIKSLGKMEIKTYCGDGPLETVMDKIYGIEKKSWKEVEKTSITTSYRQTDFYRLFSEKAKGKKWLYIKFLELNGEPIAHVYLIKYKNHLSDLKGTYIEAYKDYAPGKVLRYYLMKDIYCSGIKELDFLGKAESWKMNWTNLVRDHQNIAIYNNRSCAYLFYKIQKFYGMLAKIGENDIKLIFKTIMNKCMFFLFHKIVNILYVKELDSEAKEVKLKLDIKNLSIVVLNKYDEEYFNAIKEMRPNEEKEKHLSRFSRNDICFILITPEREVIHILWICYKEIYVINYKMNKNLYLQEKEFYMHDSFTKEKYRGQSVYQYMLAYILKYHKDKCFKRAYTDVASYNLPSIRGIEKAGFVRERVFTLCTLFNVFNFIKEKAASDTTLTNR